MPTDTSNLLDTVELKNIPIFEAGSYPQGDFDVEALQSLADNYDPAFHEAPNYLAHDDPAESRPAGNLAFGWIKKLYVRGQTLFADLTNVPRQFAELLLAGRIKKRSIELYRDLAGKGAYLRALAWPMIPQVKALADIHPTQIFSDHNDPYITVTHAFHEKEHLMTQPDPQFVTQPELQAALEKLKTDLTDELKKIISAGEVKNFCEQMVLAGKMTPAERATEEPILIAQLQREQTMSFAENQIPLSRQRMDYSRSGQAVLDLKNPTHHHTAPDHQPIVRYFHEHKDFFTRLGVSLDDLIAADRAQSTNPLVS